MEASSGEEGSELAVTEVLRTSATSCCNAVDFCCWHWLPVADLVVSCRFLKLDLSPWPFVGKCERCLVITGPFSCSMRFETVAFPLDATWLLLEAVTAASPIVSCSEGWPTAVRAESGQSLYGLPLSCWQIELALI